MIRAAEPGDIGTIVTLRGLLFEAMGATPAELADPHWQRQAARWLQVHLGDDRVHAVVAEVKGAVVSCAVGQVAGAFPSPTSPASTTGRLVNVATFPAHRRLGFSEACVTAVLDWFRDHSDVEVVTLEAAGAGESIYARTGFEPTERPTLRHLIDRGRSPGANEPLD